MQKQACIGVWMEMGKPVTCVFASHGCDVDEYCLHTDLDNHELHVCPHFCEVETVDGCVTVECDQTDEDEQARYEAGFGPDEWDARP